MNFSHMVSAGLALGVAAATTYFNVGPAVAALSGLATFAVAQAGMAYAKSHASDQMAKKALEMTDQFLANDHLIIQTLNNALSPEQKQDLKANLKEAIADTLEKVDRGETLNVSSNAYVKVLVPYLVPYIDINISNERKAAIANQILDRALAPFLVILSEKLPQLQVAKDGQSYLNSAASYYQKGASVVSYFTGTSERQPSLTELATVENAKAAVDVLQKAGDAASYLSKAWYG